MPIGYCKCGRRISTYGVLCIFCSMGLIDEYNRGEEYENEKAESPEESGFDELEENLDEED